MLNLDTHMIVYLLAGELSEQELETILKNDLAISHIVLWEIAKLVQLRRLELDMKSSDFHALLLHLNINPIRMEIAIASTALYFRGDPADEIIAATSIVEKFPLLTRDRAIRSSKKVPLAL